MAIRINSTLKILTTTLFAGSLLCSSLWAYQAYAVSSKAKAIDVFVTSVKKTKVPLILTAVGHLKAIQSVALSFESGGHITKIYTQGVRVKKGDVIMQLNDADAQATLKQDNADLQVKQSQYEAYLKLQKYGGIAASTIQQKKSDLVGAQVAVEKDNIAITKTKLLAPFDGILSTTQFSIGAYVDAGAPVIDLTQQAPLKVVYAVPSSERANIEIGQAINITSENYPKKVFSGGAVTYISPRVNMNSGTLTLEASILNKDYLLTPGMFVNINQTINPNRKLLTIPDIAIQSDLGGQYVYKIISSTSTKKIYIKTEMLGDNTASVSKGLKLGDKVVVAGQQKLMPGTPIHILPSSQNPLLKKHLKPKANKNMNHQSQAKSTPSHKASS